MRLGALLGPVGEHSSATAIVDQARALEAAGYSSLWSAQAIGRGFMMTDPFLCLSAAAAVTELEIGTAVVQAPLYHPIDLAHRVFSLQQLADNRFIFGIGPGSTAHDFNVLGRDFSSRLKDFDKQVASLRQIFEQGSRDDHTSSSPSALSEWPNVRGGPPIFFGSWGKGVERAARAFDGWIASAHYRTPDEVIAALERYRNAGGGRAIVSTIQLSAKTDLDDLAGKLNKFAEAGFDDAVVMFLPGAPNPTDVRNLVS